MLIGCPNIANGSWLAGMSIMKMMDPKGSFGGTPIGGERK
jgi:hypothetical protein